METKYGLIIDTEQYAGNFERELCAYLTGKIGHCGVGSEMTEIFPEDAVCFDNVINVSEDDASFPRPCTIYTTEGWFNNGHGGHFRCGEEAEALIDYKKKVRNYYQLQIDKRTELKERLLQGEKISNWTTTNCDTEIKRFNKIIKEADSLLDVTKYPACLSVLIHFYTAPTQEQIDFIHNRMSGFQDAMRTSSSSYKDFTVKYTGMRIMKEITTIEIESLIKN